MGNLKFRMPSIWEYLPIYKQLLGEKRNYIKDNINIDSVFGVFVGADRLAGGRFIVYDKKDWPSQQDMIDTVKFYNDNGVSVRYAYSNLVATEKHLDDPMFNFTLEIAHNELNGVIVGNPIVEKYIRSTFPKFKIISSLTNWNTSIDYAKSELDRGVDMLVLNSALVRQYDLIKDLDLSRVEVMLNDGCIKACACRFEHYSMESHINLNFDYDTMYNDPQFFENYHAWSAQFCNKRPIPPVPPPPVLPNEVPYDFILDDVTLVNNNNLDPNTVWGVNSDEYDKLCELGVMNFKVSGRELMIPPMGTFYTLKTEEQQNEIDDMFVSTIASYDRPPRPNL